MPAATRFSVAAFYDSYVFKRFGLQSPSGVDICIERSKVAKTRTAKGL